MLFKEYIKLQVTYRKKDYTLDCRVEHMLVGKKSRTWLYYCDKFGRTGTSQCFSVLRFKVSGKKQHGRLSTDGLEVVATSPNGKQAVLPATVIEADDLQKKIARAVKLLQVVARGYDQPIEVAYSGGKDSDVVLQLVREAGIKYRAIYKNTTIDPPGTIAHAERHEVEIMRSGTTFFKLMTENGYPNRNFRFCCRFLKEYKVLDKNVMGVRRAESKKREDRYTEPTECRFYGSKEEHVEAIYPILDWSDEDVVNFIELRHIDIHPLYYREDGTIDPKRRVGCMCCPLASRGIRLRYFKQYPRMVRAYIRGGQKYRELHPNGPTVLRHPDVYEWFVFDVFFEGHEKKWAKHKAGELLCGRTDYKKYLEDYFKIDLTL